MHIHNIVSVKFILCYKRLNVKYLKNYCSVFRRRNALWCKQCYLAAPLWTTRSSLYVSPLGSSVCVYPSDDEWIHLACVTITTHCTLVNNDLFDILRMYFRFRFDKALTKSICLVANYRGLRVINSAMFRLWLKFSLKSQTFNHNYVIMLVYYLTALVFFVCGSPFQNNTFFRIIFHRNVRILKLLNSVNSRLWVTTMITIK